MSSVVPNLLQLSWATKYEDYEMTKYTEVTGSALGAQCGIRGETGVGTRGPVRKKLPHRNSSAERLCSSAEDPSALEFQSYTLSRHSFSSAELHPALGF